MITPSPLFDFFKRGEVPRDVRLLAAQGALAPRAQEQLSILVLLLDDTDAEIRETADRTLKRIPEAALSAFLARSDVSLDLREFFASRGVHPSESSGEDAEAPLVQTPEPGDDLLADEQEDKVSITQKLQRMGFTEKLKAAVKGTREMRSILIRDSSKLIAAAVLSSPKLTSSEVEAIARMTSVSEDVLRIVAHNRAWMKNYKVMIGLTKNPKTPVSIAMNLIPRINDRDLVQLSIDRNVGEPVRIAARKRVLTNRTS